MPTPPLSEVHRRHLMHGFLAVHRKLAELEALIDQAGRPSPLSHLVDDLPPVEARVVRDHFARTRAAMLARLEELGLAPDPRRTSLRWALDVGLTHLQVVVDDMGPKSMAGYGPLDAAGRELVTIFQADLERLVGRARTFLRQGTGRDLAGRLARLGEWEGLSAALGALERVVTSWGLVEFRPPLERLVARAEAPAFEIGIFGRVSSGKSSLLNQVSGCDALPVGVLPVTAVPTRLERGEAPAAVVTFAEGQPRTVNLSQLCEYASEVGNSGNEKHVTGILVRLPSTRLREGVAFVDTPGVGSLARSGAAEALAYLPRCDLGVVLVDAATAPGPDDLALVAALHAEGIPAMVLLSKVDVLPAAERGRVAGYVREQLVRELGLDVPVHPVSTIGTDAALLDRWYEEEVRPLLDRNRELASASLSRKVAALGGAVAAALEVRLARARGVGSGAPGVLDPDAARGALDVADAAIRQARDHVLDWSEGREPLIEAIPDVAAHAAVGARGGSSDDEPDPLAWATRSVLDRRGQEARGLIDDLHQSLVRAVDSLRVADPSAAVDLSTARDAAPEGLPVPVLARLRSARPAGRPGWAPVLPGLARGVVARGLREHSGPLLRQVVELHDRKLRDWARRMLDRLAGDFEAQVEPVRERLRSAAVSAGPVDAAETAGLEADLRDLRSAMGGAAWAGASPAERAARDGV
jgi:GTP-binding protein EngB required for normal cell division